MVTSAISLDNIDNNVSPAENFYKYANGGWLAKNPIPPEHARWGSFEQLIDLVNDQLKAILGECIEDCSNGKDKSPSAKAIAILYASGMNEAARNEAGVQPIKDILTVIDNLQSTEQVLPLNGQMRTLYGVSPGLLNIYSSPDDKNSSWEVLKLTQHGALGLPDRDFYVLEDKEEMCKKYIQHVAKMLLLGGCQPNLDAATSAAEKFFQLEKTLAKACLTRTQLRDPIKTYHNYSGTKQLSEATEPEGKYLPWSKFFSEMNITEEAAKTILCDNPEYCKALAEQLQETPLDVWKTALQFRTLKSTADYLSTEIEQEKFEFYGKVMVGQQQMKPRWKRVLVGGVVGLLEDSIGKMYTDRHFGSDAKEACLYMVNILTEILRKKIEKVDWMEPDTKEKAKEKLDKFRPMIGYPDKWDIEDIPQLLEQVGMDKPYATNARACEVREFRKMVERIDKAVDPNKWEMPACMVNAYFHPNKNVIVFPAAILQPPFFYHPTPEAPYGDVPVNFSAIGAVICHEITHGYDDQGRQFDSNGELSDWWTKNDSEKYEKRAANMVKLCDESTIFGKNLNGKLCLGENIADYGGVKLSYQGLRSHMEEHGRPEDIDGFTPEQRFFLGWASIWRNNIREENALQRIVTDPHAPGEFRANIVQVIEEFHNAFNVKEGDKMWTSPSARCDIW